MALDAREIIRRLKLEPLPFEGGFFRQTYKSRGGIAASSLHATPHAFSTAIYYLVTNESFSALHRVPQDEVFHFYLGDPVEMWQLEDSGADRTLTIGPDLLNGQEPQIVAPGGVWQGTRLLPGGKWALLGATVAPGYEQTDFELATRADLLTKFPRHRERILKFTN